MRLHPTSHVRTRQSQLNVTHPDQTRAMAEATASLFPGPGPAPAGAPRADTAPAMALPVQRSVLLYPGDLLFLPAFVFHHVHAETSSVSINAFRPSLGSDAIHSLRLLGVPRSILGKGAGGGDMVPSALASLLTRLAHQGVRRAQARGLSTSGFVRQHLLSRYLTGEPSCGCQGFDERQCPSLALLPADENTILDDHVTDLSAMLDRVHAAAATSTAPARAAAEPAAAGPGAPATLRHAPSYAQGLRLLLLANYMDDLTAAVVGPARACHFLQCLAKVWV